MKWRPQRAALLLTGQIIVVPEPWAVRLEPIAYDGKFI